MANQDRIERFSKVRAWLDNPFPQRPTPHQILNQMLTAEQTLNLRLTNTRQPWNLISTTITTVEGTSTYAITQPVASYQNSGKVHFVIRTTADEHAPYLPVPFDNMDGLAYGQMPPEGQVNASLTVPEKVTFYRANMQSQVINAVIQPTPQEALTYTVWFFAGSLDRTQALLTGTGPLTELSDYLDLKTALLLLPYTDWRSDDDTHNRDRRTELAVSLGVQVAELEPIVEKYISQLSAPKSFTMTCWNE